MDREDAIPPARWGNNCALDGIEVPNERVSEPVNELPA
jgi:hypothetical protein